MPSTQVVKVLSPNGQVSFELGLKKSNQGDMIPHYRVTLKDKELIQFSRLGIDLEGGQALGGACGVESLTTRSGRAVYEVFPGKRRHVVDQYSEAVISLCEQTSTQRRWELVVRAYDDGVAFRYGFPSQKEWPKLAIANEHTEFSLPQNARAVALPLNGFTTSYEQLYESKLIAAIPKDWLLGLPLLVECPDRGWAAITEANLTEYAGMYLAHTGQDSSVLTSRLSPLPKEQKIAVKASLPHKSPWRVVLMAADPCRFIESDLVLNLNEPCALKDTSWIKTGKTTFPWWNGFYLENVPFKPGLNTATMKHYIDFCAEAGIPYHSLDGIDNIGWYGCEIVPHKKADLTKAVPAIDMPELLQYARAKGVRLRLWMHWKDVKDQIDQAFPLYQSWGIEGVMLDFMDRDDQEMIRFLREVLIKAAKNHLTVTLHGMSKPTGLERTYPHLLTSEGVRNLEYDKWDKIGCPPEHEVTVPFTRMLAGPLDFHQGSFRGVSVADFKPRNDAPLVMGTPSRTLASYVVFQNHLSMVADYPSAYRTHPALPMLAKIPTSWDDTKVISGIVGKHIAVARKNGADWYVGIMNDRKRRNLEIPLRFLDTGVYRAEIYADDLNSKPGRQLARRVEKVTAQDDLKASLESAGGFMVHLTPLAEKTSK